MATKHWGMHRDALRPARTFRLLPAGPGLSQVVSSNGTVTRALSELAAHRILRELERLEREQPLTTGPVEILKLARGTRLQVVR